MSLFACGSNLFEQLSGATAAATSHSGRLSPTAISAASRGAVELDNGGDDAVWPALRQLPRDLERVLCAEWECVIIQRREGKGLIRAGYDAQTDTCGAMSVLPEHVLRQALMCEPFVSTSADNRIVVQYRRKRKRTLEFPGGALHAAVRKGDKRCFVVDGIGGLWSFLLSNPEDEPRRAEVRCSGSSPPSRPEFSFVEAGLCHCLALTSDGQLYSWGSGRFGQLGHGSVSDVDQPTLIAALQGVRIIQIACGERHSVVLSETGDVYTFGCNARGQLGRRITSSDNREGMGASPGLVDEDLPDDEEAGVIDIACGSHHTVVVTADGKLWTCGWGKYGQLGRELPLCEDFDARFRPADIPGGGTYRVRGCTCGGWITFVESEPTST